MRVTAIRFLLGLALVVLCGCASQVPQARSSPLHRFSLNQDTPPASFSSWKGHDMPSSGNLTTTVTFKELRLDPQWSPFVAFEIRSSEFSSMYGRVSLHFTSIGQTACTLDFRGDEVAQVSVPVHFKVGEQIAVRLEWVHRKHLRVRVNSEKIYETPLLITPDEIRILSGSANVDINDVAIQ